MMPAPSFSNIDSLLNDESFELGQGIVDGFPVETRTVGFLIFDQNYSRSPIQDLVGNLDMLNIHSGTHMHFFLCGVSKFGKSEEEGRHLGEMGGVSLYHNARATSSFIEAFERMIPGRRYSLGFDLILVDVTEEGGQRKLDFSNTAYFRVEELIKQKIIDRPSELLGKLIKFAREGGIANAAEMRDELAVLFEKKMAAGTFIGDVSQASPIVGASRNSPVRWNRNAGIMKDPMLRDFNLRGDAHKDSSIAAAVNHCGYVTPYRSALGVVRDCRLALFPPRA